MPSELKDRIAEALAESGKSKPQALAKSMKKNRRPMALSKFQNTKSLLVLATALLQVMKKSPRFGGHCTEKIG